MKVLFLKNKNKMQFRKFSYCKATTGINKQNSKSQPIQEIDVRYLNEYFAPNI